jgi:hypothetical protein
MIWYPFQLQVSLHPPFHMRHVMLNTATYGGDVNLQMLKELVA